MSIDWEQAVKGKKLEQFLAMMDGVQGAVEESQFVIGVRAEENLAALRSGRDTKDDVKGAEIKTDRGRIDRYVILEDVSSSRQGGNVNSALSIELGRNAYDVTLLSPDGETVNEYTVGAKGGSYILTDAARLPRRNKGGAKVKRHVKIRMKKGGRVRGRPSRGD
ncbi:hypothetical protein [Streptomyces sp. NPDC048623]|uniref:hypothetical protein n=1 Tax=Streptomyces sp. NPDC048623 TaxID=3155761 RepID=UPI00343AB416